MTELKLLASAKVNGTIPVHKYQSNLTGITVVLAQVEGPVVNGYFTLGWKNNLVKPLVPLITQTYFQLLKRTMTTAYRIPLSI